jgi:hypothetical protein
LALNRYGVHEHSPESNVLISFPQTFEYESQSLPSSEILQPRLHSTSASPSLNRSLGGSHNYQAIDLSRGGQYVTNSEAPALTDNNIQLFDEYYPSTMSNDDLVKTFATIASSRFSSLDPSRLDALLTKTVEDIEKENQSSARLSSQSENSLFSSKGQDRFRSRDSEYLDTPEDRFLSDY